MLPIQHFPPELDNIFSKVPWRKVAQKSLVLLRSLMKLKKDFGQYETGKKKQRKRKRKKKKKKKEHTSEKIFSGAKSNREVSLWRYLS